MSIGSCVIDTVDIWSLGAMVLRESDFELLSYPERKPPLTVDWFERDGLDVDLSDAFYKEKKVVMRYFLSAADSLDYVQHLESLIGLHEQPGHRAIYLRDLDKTFILRYLGCSDYDHAHGIIQAGRKCGTLSVEYSMDDPLQLIGTVTVPVLLRPFQTHVTVNAYDLSLFGITVSGFYNTALRGAYLKQGVAYTSERTTGTIVDTAFLAKRQSKELIIECTMQALTRSAFYDAYSALWHQINSANLTIGYGGNKTLKAYYCSMSDFKKVKAFQSGVYVSFTLHFKTI